MAAWLGLPVLPCLLTCPFALAPQGEVRSLELSLLESKGQLASQGQFVRELQERLQEKESEVAGLKNRRGREKEGFSPPLAALSQARDVFPVRRVRDQSNSQQGAQESVRLLEQERESLVTQLHAARTERGQLEARTLLLEQERVDLLQRIKARGHFRQLDRPEGPARRPPPLCAFFPTAADREEPRGHAS